MRTRTLLLRFGFAGATLLLWSGLRSAPRPDVATAYILGPDEGEILSVRNTKVIVKVDPRTGSSGMASGTQELGPGAGIPLHKHDNADEMLVVQKGSATAILGDVHKPAVAGSTIFIPKGVWHGVEPVKEQSQLLWVVTPPGLEGYFRDLAGKQLTPAETHEIARKHGVVLP